MSLLETEKEHTQIGDMLTRRHADSDGEDERLSTSFLSNQEISSSSTCFSVDADFLYDPMNSTTSQQPLQVLQGPCYEVETKVRDRVESSQSSAFTTTITTRNRLLSSPTPEISDRTEREHFEPCASHVSFPKSPTESVERTASPPPPSTSTFTLSSSQTFSEPIDHCTNRMRPVPEKSNSPTTNSRIHPPLSSGIEVDLSSSTHPSPSDLNLESLRTELSITKLLSLFTQLLTDSTPETKRILILLREKLEEEEEDGEEKTISFLVEIDSMANSAASPTPVRIEEYELSQIHSEGIESVTSNQESILLENDSILIIPIIYESENKLIGILSLEFELNEEEEEEEEISFDPTIRKRIEYFCSEISNSLRNAIFVRELETTGRRFKGLFDAIPSAIRQDDWTHVIPFLSSSGFFDAEDPVEFLHAQTDDFILQAAGKAKTITLSADYVRMFGSVDFGGGLGMIVDREVIMRNMRTVFASCHPNSDGRQLEMKTNEARPRYFLIHYHFNPTTQILLLSHVDITLLREEQLKTNQQKKLMVDLNQRHKELWSGIGQIVHEIRNPLFGVFGGIEIIVGLLNDVRMETEEQGTSLTLSNQFDVMEETLSGMRFAAAFQKSVLNLTIDLSQLENGSLQINLRDGVELLPLMKSIVQILAPKAERSESKLRLADDLEEKIGHLSIVTDELRLEQILMNLCSNACKFTVKGMIELDVNVIKDDPTTITTDDDDQTLSNSIIGLEFSVSDTGIGMDEEELTTLFQKFSQANSSIQSRFGGSGLGLFLAQNIANLLGGMIRVESEKGVGSVFTLDLPRVRLGRARSRSESFSSIGISSVGSLEDDEQYYDNEERIIVWFADDQAPNRTVIEFFLRDTQYDLSTFENGKVLLDSFKSHLPEDRPTFIILDLAMPVMDGFETCQELVKLGSAATLYCLSGNYTVRTEKKCQECGFEVLLGKPISRDELIGVLNRGLVNRRANQNPVSEEMVMIRYRRRSTTSLLSDRESRVETMERSATLMSEVFEEEEDASCARERRGVEERRKSPHLRFFQIVGIVILIVLVWELVRSILW